MVGLRSVGGYMVKKMIEAQENILRQEEVYDFKMDGIREKSRF